MVQTASSSKNIWVAASDGDLDRVQELIENGGMSANDFDPNSYSPMHAAASYAHLDILAYLLSKGGNINLQDEEGETPLFTVETMAAAQFLVEHGADVSIENNDGIVAADFLEEDHPEISTYLRSLSPQAPPPPTTHAQTSGPPEVSNLAIESYASAQTSSLMEESRRIMEEAERDGMEPDERLRELVERAVAEGINFGGGLGDAAEGVNGVDGEGGTAEKRTRSNGS